MYATMYRTVSFGAVADRPVTPIGNGREWYKIMKLGTIQCLGRHVVSRCHINSIRMILSRHLADFKLLTLFLCAVHLVTSLFYSLLSYFRFTLLLGQLSFQVSSLYPQCILLIFGAFILDNRGVSIDRRPVELIAQGVLYFHSFCQYRIWTPLILC